MKVILIIILLLKFYLDPQTLDFGNICPNILETKWITFINPLDRFILITLEIKRPELDQTHPRQFMVQAQSKIKIPIKIVSANYGKIHWFVFSFI